MGILPEYSIKDIIELVKKGAEIEAQEKIMELRQAALDLQEENIALREKLRDLEEHLNVKSQMQFDGTVYWLERDETKEGPYCQLCYDKEGKLINLQADSERWRCLGCKKAFYPGKKKKKWPLTSHGD